MLWSSWCLLLCLLQAHHCNFCPLQLTVSVLASHHPCTQTLCSQTLSVTEGCLQWDVPNSLLMWVMIFDIYSIQSWHNTLWNWLSCIELPRSHFVALETKHLNFLAFKREMLVPGWPSLYKQGHFAKELGLDCGRTQEIFLFYRPFELWPTQPSVKGLQEMKRMGHETNHSLPPRTPKLINWYILLTAVGSKPDGSCKYTFTHKQYTKQHNETEYNTYITIKIYKHTIRIHKNNNKNT